MTTRFMLRQPTWRCKNDSAETIPFGAVMRIVSTTADGNDIVINVNKPNSSILPDYTKYVFNAGNPIPAGGYGECLFSYPVLAVVEGTTNKGLPVGPKSGSWYLNPASATASLAFTVMLDDPARAYYSSSTLRSWIVQPFAGPRFFRAALSGPMNSGTGDNCTLSSSAGTSTGQTTRVKDPLGIFGSKSTGTIWCFYQELEFIAVQAPC